MLRSGLSYGRLCRKTLVGAAVILSEVKNLVFTVSYKNQILRLTPQNDMVTLSLEQESCSS